jgi:hypothetical protein
MEDFLRNIFGRSGLQLICPLHPTLIFQKFIRLRESALNFSNDAGNVTVLYIRKKFARFALDAITDG